MVFWVVPIKIDVGKTMQGGDTTLRGGNGRAYKDELKARQWRVMQLDVLNGYVTLLYGSFKE